VLPHLIYCPDYSSFSTLEIAPYLRFESGRTNLGVLLQRQKQYFVRLILLGLRFHFRYSDRQFLKFRQNRQLALDLNLWLHEFGGGSRQYFFDPYTPPFYSIIYKKTIFEYMITELVKKIFALYNDFAKLIFEAYG